MVQQAISTVLETTKPEIDILYKVTTWTFSTFLKDWNFKVNNESSSFL